MAETLIYKSVGPIGATDPMNMPVRDIDRAISYYVDRMGFSVVSRSETPCRSVTLERDTVQIGLAENGGDPEQASVYMEVNDVNAARQDLLARGLMPNEVRPMEHGGRLYRVFFVKDDDGLCYCIGQKQTV